MKCKDYFIIKINTYVDIKPLYIYKNGGIYPNKQQEERSTNHFDFQWQLVEKISGFNNEFFCTKYDWIYARELSLDYIQEFSGVIVQRNYEEWITYYIPKDKEYIFNWCIENIKNPYKVVKKTHLPRIHQIDIIIKNDVNIRLRKDKILKIKNK